MMKYSRHFMKILRITHPMYAFLRVWYFFKHSPGWSVGILALRGVSAVCYLA